MIILSEDAASKIVEILNEEGPNTKVRVFVQGGGCSGFSYGFSIDEKIESDDFVIESHNVKILVDAMSITYLEGAEIDYKEGLDGSSFVIKNPNATTTCGCGSSFSPYW